MKLSDKTYEVLKWMVLICIPALTTFYVVLDKTFGWGYSEVVTTISAAACTLIGSLIGISTATYHKEQNTELPEDMYGEEE